MNGKCDNKRHRKASESYRASLESQRPEAAIAIGVPSETTVWIRHRKRLPFYSGYFTHITAVQCYILIRQVRLSEFTNLVHIN